MVPAPISVDFGGAAIGASDSAPPNFKDLDTSTENQFLVVYFKFDGADARDG